MTDYELTVILPLQTEAEQKEMLNKIEETLKGLGAELSGSQLLARGRLPYPIKNTKQGQHCLIGFKSETNKIGEINSSLRLLNGIVRFDISQKEKAPKPVVREIEKPVVARGWTERKTEEEVVKPQAEAEEKPTLADLDKKLDEILKSEI